MKLSPAIQRKLARIWLGHADARQVCDLPKGPFQTERSMTAGSETLRENERLPASLRLAAHQRGRAIPSGGSFDSPASPLN